MTDALIPRLGEIWEDAEGTLMTYAATDTKNVQWWWCFGAAHPVPETNPKVIQPLRRVFLEDGTLDIDSFVNDAESPYRLRYSNGHNVTWTEM